jgi:hypothetical protein
MSSDTAELETRAALPTWAAVCDATALIALLVSASLFAGGGFRFWLGALRISMTSGTAPLAIGVVLLVIRHALVRRPNLLDRMRGWVRVLSGSERWRAARGPFLASRLAVPVIGLLAVYTVGYAPGAPPYRESDSEVANLPIRWDAGWYLNIARIGYMWTPRDTRRQQNIVFFPAYPMMIRTAARFFGGAQPAYVLAGLLISHAAFLWALLLLFELARTELNDVGAARATLALAASYPFSVFHGAIYTDSLFLLGAIGAILAYRREQWGRSSAWGLLVGLTRPNGFLLAITLGTCGLVQRVWERREPGRQRQLLALAAMVMPLVGTAIFSMFLAWMTGNPLQWSAQQAAWGRTFKGVPFADAAGFAAEHGFESYVATLPYDFLNAVPAICALALIVPVWLQVGPAYAVFLATNLVPPLLVGGLMSMGRFTASMFPLFLWLALKGQQSTTMIVLIFAMLQALIAVLFYTWRPLF